MSKTLAKSRPRQETVVALKEQVAGIRGPDGEIVPAEKLEVGTVRELSDNPDELEPMDPETRLIATYQVGEGEVKTLDKYKLVTSAGLSHNWTIERWPANVVRVIRSDGWAWT